MRSTAPRPRSSWPGAPLWPGPGQARGLWLAVAIAGLAAGACSRQAPPGAGASTGSAPGESEKGAPAAEPDEPDPMVAAEREIAAEAQHAVAQGRLVQQRAYDTIHVDEHRALLSFVKKTRARFDQAAAQLRGRPASVGARRIEELQTSQLRAISARIDELQGLDPTGSQSALTADHGTNLNFLADEYPAAIIGALAGDPEPLDEIRAEMDLHQENIQLALQRLTRRR
jgi:hypothetical protein